jgi:hypothetical protein
MLRRRPRLSTCGLMPGGIGQSAGPVSQARPAAMPARWGWQFKPAPHKPSAPRSWPWWRPARPLKPAHCPAAQVRPSRAVSQGRAAMPPRPVSESPPPRGGAASWRPLGQAGAVSRSPRSWPPSEPPANMSTRQGLCSCRRAGGSRQGGPPPAGMAPDRKARKPRPSRKPASAWGGLGGPAPARASGAGLKHHAMVCHRRPGGHHMLEAGILQTRSARRKPRYNQRRERNCSALEGSCPMTAGGPNRPLFLRLGPGVASRLEA